MKKFLFALLLLFLLSPFLVFAQNDETQIFKAEVIEILEEREFIDEIDGTDIQQNLRLRGLEGELENKEFTFEGIHDFVVTAKNIYQPGDRVIVSQSRNMDGNDEFYIVDYVRTSKLYLLAIIFVLSVIIVGRWKGVKSLISLVVSFVVILKFIIPQILAGSNPLIIGILGSLIILFFAIYLTQGINKKAHLINLSLTVSLVFTGILSFIFTNITKLSGFASEESIYLVNVYGSTINLRGLLLAGILIGAIGVLDDMIVNQVSAIEQIKKANPGLSTKEVLKRGMKIGIDHISSMTNTLFFAYVGVSLPLIILFSINEPPFINFEQVINNEIIATEIVRTLVGSIGLVLAIPITNFLASYFLRMKK